jgi:hypothetical protein
VYNSPGLGVCVCMSLSFPDSDGETAEAEANLTYPTSQPTPTGKLGVGERPELVVTILGREMSFAQILSHVPDGFH